MGHAVERFGATTQELGGRAVSRVGNLLHSQGLQMRGRALQEHGRTLREAAAAASREEGEHAVEARIEEVFGTQDESRP